MINMDAEVRRADLKLRAEYPHIISRIFKREKEGFYSIYVENYIGDFEDLKKQFDKTIRPISSPFNLVKDIPGKFIKELPQIDDKDIAANYAGIPFNTTDIENLLIVKFPDIEICHIEGNAGDNKIRVFVKKIYDEKRREALINFLSSLEEPIPIILIENEEQIKNGLLVREKRAKNLQKFRNSNPKVSATLDSLDSPVFNIFPTKLERYKKVFEERDETFWFDNIGEIYNGTVTRQNLIELDEGLNSCYLDYASFKNVNIRNG